MYGPLSRRSNPRGRPTLYVKCRETPRAGIELARAMCPSEVNRLSSFTVSGITNELKGRG